MFVHAWLSREESFRRLQRVWVLERRTFETFGPAAAQFFTLSMENGARTSTNCHSPPVDGRRSVEREENTIIIFTPPKAGRKFVFWSKWQQTLRRKSFAHIEESSFYITKSHSLYLLTLCMHKVTFIE
jgi:hypothetical protein